MSEMPGVLDLSGANTKGFDPIPSGSYAATVFDINIKHTSNPDGNLPEGTPGYNVQFAIDGGEFDNRRVFNTYWMPPADYDEKKRANMQGMFVRFLYAIGYSEKEVLSGKFKFDPNEAIGRECTVVVGLKPATEQYEASNTVKNVKQRSEATAGDDII